MTAPARRIVALLLALWGLVLPGCRREVPIAPPEIVFGEDPCAHCRMIISDTRFAAACVADMPDGTRQRPAFDDFACLIAWEREHPDARIVARYVRDFETGRWLDATTARYVASQEIHSPMASGVAACATEQAAAMLAARHAGKTMDFNQVRDLLTSADP